MILEIFEKYIREDIMKIKITGDSTIDLTSEQRKKFNIDVIGVNVIFDGKEYQDGVNISSDQLLEMIDKTGNLPKTASLNAQNYIDFFQKFFDEGYDSVIHFSFSSELSLLNSAAVQASKEMKNVYVINTLSLSSGSGLLALHAAELAQSKKYDAKTIFEKCQARVPAIQASFVLDKLTLLHKGGRCSMIAAIGANLLKIKPCIQVVEGKMKVVRKYRGKMQVVVSEYVQDTLALYNTPDTTRCFITYTTVTPDILKNVREELKKYGKFKEIIESRASATITSHCGHNTIGILYLNDGKPEQEQLSLDL